MRAIGFIGAGAVGTALATAFVSARQNVAAIYSRNAEARDRLAGQLSLNEPSEAAQDVVDRCAVIFLTVPDAAIGPVASMLRWRPEQVAVHCSGALGTAVLAEAGRQGASVVALHPLCTLPRKVEARIPAGTRFAYTGPAELQPFFASLVADIGGALLDLPEAARALYHAAVVIACNYTVTLAATATSLLGSLGMRHEDALAALLPLLRGTVENLERAGLPAALTGPVVRGDLGTVEAHRAALAGTEAAALYDVLASATAALALNRSDISDEVRQALIALSLTRLPSGMQHQDRAVLPGSNAGGKS